MFQLPSRLTPRLLPLVVALGAAACGSPTHDQPDASGDSLQALLGDQGDAIERGAVITQLLAAPPPPQAPATSVLIAAAPPPSQTDATASPAEQLPQQEASQNPGTDTPQLTIRTDRTAYHPEDAYRVSINLDYSGPELHADLIIALASGDDWYFFPSWAGSEERLTVTIPAGLSFTDAPFVQATLPAEVGDGVHTWYAGLFRVGTSDPYAPVSSASCGIHRPSTPAGPMDGQAITALVDPDLDLHHQVATTAPQAGQPLVAPGPRLVVGEGAAPQNHTMVRLLDATGITATQFLAYPSWIRGGVTVSSGRLFDQAMGVVTAPLSDARIDEVRLFDTAGILRSAFIPDPTLRPPFVIAVGDYLATPGDEISVASRDAASLAPPIHIHGADGQLRAVVSAPGPDAPTVDTLGLSTVHLSDADVLLLHFRQAQTAFMLQAATGQHVSYSTAAMPADTAVSESAFLDEILLGGGDEPTFSTLYRLHSDQSVSQLDAATRETRFWIHPAQTDGPWLDSPYVRHGRYRHVRTDMYSPGFRDDIDFDCDEFEHWAGGSFEEFIDFTQADYFSSDPSVWEPTFTHRWFSNTPDEWRDEVDPAHGHPKYPQLSRLYSPASYDEGESSFVIMTYAQGLPAIDHLYVWPLRAYLRRLAEKFRGSGGDPAQLIALEPNHEMEIFIQRDQYGDQGSIGDYNLAMVSGFRAHLLALYGDLPHINQRFGTAFATPADFDAPRNLWEYVPGRDQQWDEYRPDNSFFRAWVDYNRKVILARIAQGMRESLLAGFPPEVIKTHQIPSVSALGPVEQSRRITPISWIFSAGTGFGATRYGLWHTEEENFLASAQRSGQSLVTIGEYHPYTYDLDAATDQARYLFDHGAIFLHSMTFDEPRNSIAQAAYLALQSEDRPRPGTAGGVGPMRAVCQPPVGGGSCQPYNIVQIGRGEDRPGLLKSVGQDGRWEGTVYVTPFHAHLDVNALIEERDMVLGADQLTSPGLTHLMPGDQIEIRLRARSTSPDAKLSLLVLHDGTELPGHRRIIEVGPQWQFLRYTLRVQLPLDEVQVLLHAGERDTSSAFQQQVQIEALSLLVHTERTARPEYGEPASAMPHAGGVTFDLLSASHVPASTTSSPF